MTDDGWVIRVCNDPEKDWIERSKKEEMTDDIVTRLREDCDTDCKYATVNEFTACDKCEAADEIERLRLANKKIVNAGYLLADFIQHNTACSCTDNELCMKCSTLNKWDIAVHTWN